MTIGGSFRQSLPRRLKGELISALPGQSTGEKKLKTDILEVVFMTRSWARIKEFSPDLLKKGLGSVKQLCSLLKTNGGVPEGEDTVTWLRGELSRADDNVPDFMGHARA